MMKPYAFSIVIVLLLSAIAILAEEKSRLAMIVMPEGMLLPAGKHF